MARPKKADEQKLAPAMQPQPHAPTHTLALAHAHTGTAAVSSVAGAPPAVNQANRSIDVPNFIRVRDSVYSRLLMIQGIIGSFAADYLTQTNLLLGESALLDGGEHQPQALDELLNAQPAQAHMPMVGVPVGVLVGAVPPVGGEEKRERKKRQHDPNAPKRPLTPYFLYMQTARPIIAADLGDGVAKGAVQEEGQRRWGSMSAQEKLGWNQAYQYNLRLYNARVHSYKSGNANAKEMSDEEAARYCEEYQIPMPHVGGIENDVVIDNAGIAEQMQQPLSAPTTYEESVGKTPKAKSSRKRKSEAVEPAQSTPAAAGGALASPDRKRKRTSTKPVEQPEKDEPKKSGRKKAKSG